jgi:hypothetical protein
MFDMVCTSPGAVMVVYTTSTVANAGTPTCGDDGSTVAVMVTPPTVSLAVPEPLVTKIPLASYNDKTTVTVCEVTAHLNVALNVYDTSLPIGRQYKPVMSGKPVTPLFVDVNIATPDDTAVRVTTPAPYVTAAFDVKRPDDGLSHPDTTPAPLMYVGAMFWSLTVNAPDAPKLPSADAYTAVG